MQQTTLGCDWCTAERKNGLRPFAVITRTLGNGKPRPKDPSLDLCQKHDRELVRMFRPKAKIGRPANGTHTGGRQPGVVTEADRKAQASRAAKFEPRWKEREQKMLAALKGSPGMLGPELCKAAKMSKHYVYKVTNRLIAAGKVKRVGDGGERKGFVLA